MQFKLTPAMTTIAHIISGGFIGLLSSSISAVVQYNGTHALTWSDVGTDFVVFAVAFLAGLSSSYIHVVASIRQSPALPQAESDVVSIVAPLVESKMNALESRLRASLSAQSSTAQPTPVQATTPLSDTKNVA